MKSRCIYLKYLLLIFVITLISCTPHINSLNPNNGPERTMVEVDGDNFLSTIYWDAETPSEQKITGGFLGSYLFTVPQGSAQGIHQVQLQRSGKRSNKAAFTVTAPLPFGAPRIERISLLYAGFQSGNQVNTWLYVQGANVDAGAEVLINGSVVPTSAHKGIQNELFGVNPQDLNYPIYHYLALLAAPGVQPAGTVLNVQIRNVDGQTSGTVQYRLPDNAASMDSDGDDIPDDWEKNGYDADNDGTIDIDLAALGADPLRPDIFIEVDVMNGLTNTPGNATWNAVRAGFDNAPIINPTSDNGINLVLDATGTVPYFQRISLTAAHDPTNGLANFYTLKTNNFNNAVRGRIYHYCIWGNAQPGGYSGISDVKMNAAGTDFAEPGDDFIVSFDDFSASCQSVRSMAATFMHELGHNLQQRHGGVNHARYNPTYNSVMSYSWQLRTGLTNATRISRPIYAPYYYQLNNAVENNGAIPAGVVSVLPDYSEGMGRNLIENNLNETVGLYNNNRVDWNQDGDTQDTGISRDLTEDGDTNDTAIDFPNWINLVFSGPRQNGEYGN
ncbi:MAG: hypothetical protein ACMUIU_15200 [bacterium]